MSAGPTHGGTPGPATVPGRQSPGWAGRDWLWAGALLFLGAALRVAFLLRMELPTFDPWRHLLLIRNLRDGLGFTLFDGQPYIWYSPVWYRLCALFPRAWGPEWIAGFLSSLVVPMAYVFVRTSGRGGSRTQAVTVSALLAASGPMIVFTCHYGQEAFALCAMFGSLLACGLSRGARASVLGGLLAGVALVARMNFAFVSLLVVPLLGSRRRWIGFGLGAAVPLAMTWWRHHRAIATHPWLFTWDGLATRSADFNLASTLLVQLHPDVHAGLRRLHQAMVPWPEWVRDAGGMRWDGIVFVGCGILCLLACRRLGLALVGLATLAYFLLLDDTLSANFFRIYLPVFPVFFLAAGRVVERFRSSGTRRGDIGAAALVGTMLLAGAPYLRPPAPYTLEEVTAPPRVVPPGAGVLVNSAFYHPESMIYRYPETRFVGMPLDPTHWDEFHARFPDYRMALWQEFGIQNDLFRWLVETGRFRIAGAVPNAYGNRYVVLQPGTATEGRSSSRSGGRTSTSRNRRWPIGPPAPIAPDAPGRSGRAGPAGSPSRAGAAPATP